MLIAKDKNYKVVGVDTFDHTDYSLGEFDSLETAQMVAKNHAGTMTKVYIYDGQGRLCGDFGTF